MKSIVISIRPEHALNILNGSKTLELRKSVPKGYVGWVYGYVTKGKHELYFNTKNKEYVLCDNTTNITYYDKDFQEAMNSDLLNGTIPFRFWFEEYISYKYYADDNTYFVKRPQDFGYGAEGVLKSLCLTRDEFKEYGQGKDLYAWHIKKLEVFDKPMKLEEFQNYMPKSNDIPEALITSSWQILHQPLTKAPQSWQYVYVKGE